MFTTEKVRNQWYIVRRQWVDLSVEVFEISKRW